MFFHYIIFGFFDAASSEGAYTLKNSGKFVEKLEINGLPVYEDLEEGEIGGRDGCRHDCRLCNPAGPPDP